MSLDSQRLSFDSLRMLLDSHRMSFSSQRMSVGFQRVSLDSHRMSFDSPRVGTGFGKMSEEGLGGESDKIYKESLDEEAILLELDGLFSEFSKQRKSDETFGDFSFRKKFKQTK